MRTLKDGFMLAFGVCLGKMMANLIFGIIRASKVIEKLEARTIKDEEDLGKKIKMGFHVD